MLFRSGSPFSPGSRHDSFGFGATLRHQGRILDSSNIWCGRHFLQAGSGVSHQGRNLDSRNVWRERHSLRAGVAPDTVSEGCGDVSQQQPWISHGPVRASEQVSRWRSPGFCRQLVCGLPGEELSASTEMVLASIFQRILNGIEGARAPSLGLVETATTRPLRPGKSRLSWP